jgi:hypothetical protein
LSKSLDAANDAATTAATGKLPALNLVSSGTTMTSSRDNRSVLGGWQRGLADFIHLRAGADGGLWDHEAWNAALVARRATIQENALWGTFRVRNNPVMPSWLPTLVQGRGYPDDDASTPSLLALPMERLDWFTLASMRPHELTITIHEPSTYETVTITQVLAAWHLVRSAGCIPMLGLHLVPTRPWGTPRVTAEVSAFHAVTPAGMPTLDKELTQVLGLKRRAITSHYVSHDSSEMLQGRVATWDWTFDAL